MSSGVMTTGTFPKLLVPGINQLFGIDYAKLPKIREMLFDLRTSDKYFEEDVELHGIGVASVKNEGGAIAFDSMGQGLIQRYTHLTYGKGMTITKESVEDNQYQSHIARMAPELAKSLNEAMETEAANILNRAFNTTYTFADGQPLCDTDKVVSGTGGTYQNRLTTFADLSETALEQAVIDIHGLVAADGLRMDVNPVCLIVPKEEQFNALRILKTDGRVQTADNDLNALKTMGMIPKIVMWRYLTDVDAWFIKTDVKDGLVFMNRRAPAVDSDNEFTTDNMLFKATARFSVGSSNQRGIYGSQGA